MNSFFKIFLFFWLTVPCYAETLDLSSGHEMKRIAFSAKEGVEVFSESVNGTWCDNILSLKIFAQDDAAFSEQAIAKLMNKVGVILESECGQAEQAIIDGYRNNTLVYQGGASKSDKWKPEKGALKMKIRQLQVAAVNQSQSKKGFLVKEWTPPADNQKIVAHIDSSANEFRLYSKNKSCSILYTADKTSEEMKNWFISVGNNSCSENLIYGRADVAVFDQVGDLIETLDGYFTEGRFTGRRNLNMVLLNRYGAGKRVQNISYVIDSDPDLKIHYIGFLKARYNHRTKRYLPWQGCSPFTIAAVTENETLFLEQTVVDNILRTTQSYADIFCPGATSMKFFASTVPQGISGMDLPDGTGEGQDALIYAAQLKRKVGKKWEIASDKTQNLARLREAERNSEDMRENQLMMADYNDLLKADYLGRLAYMIGVDRIDNLPEMLLASRIINKPVRVNLLVHVNSAGITTALADWPREILITETSGLLNQTGWHLVSGTLRPVLTADIKAHKIASTTAGVLELSASTACETNGCSEISDLTGLIRRRFEKPNWSPYQQKGKRP